MTQPISIDLSQIDKFEKKTLQKIKAFAYPLAIKNTLNSLAFQSMRSAKKTIAEDFINRNKFTERSIRVTPTKTIKIKEMVASVGSVADYMEKQEGGAKISSKGKQGLRIPTGAAAGQAKSFPRLKPIRKQFRHGQIKLAGPINANSRSQFILMSIRVASLRGQSPFVFLPFGGKRTGVYRVKPTGSPPPTRYKRGKKSFSRKNKWGRPKGTPGKEKLIFIHSFAKRTIIIPKTNWLSKNVTLVSGNMVVVFKKEADRVFDRFVK